MEITFKGSLPEFQAIFAHGFPLANVSNTFTPSELDELVAADQIKLETPPPLALVPQQEAAVGAGPADYEEGLPLMPENDPSVLAGMVNLPKLTPEQRQGAWTAFVSFCAQWVKGFEAEGVEQPDRLALMTKLGSGRWPIPVLVMAYEIKSFQRLVERALIEGAGLTIKDSTEAYLDYVDRVAGTMTQVSHMGFPDLANAMDWSRRWRRDTAFAHHTEE
jgi:hypothetical protein